MDLETENFIKRFGRADSPLESQFNQDFGSEGLDYKAGMKNVQSNGGLLSEDRKFDIGHDSVAIDGVDAGTDKLSGIASKAGKVAGIAGQAMGAVTDGMKLVDNIKGGQFDTSAEGGGVGKAGGAIMDGTMTGAKFGQTLGKLAGPTGELIGMGVGAVAGGLTSTFAHSAARKKYNENRKDFNLKESALERSKRADDYARSEGLASMEDLKALRKKQLNIIS